MTSASVWAGVGAGLTIAKSSALSSMTPHHHIANHLQKVVDRLGRLWRPLVLVHHQVGDGSFQHLSHRRRVPALGEKEGRAAVCAQEQRGCSHKGNRLMMIISTRLEALRTVKPVHGLLDPRISNSSSGMTTVATSCLITCKGRQGGVLQDGTLRIYVLQRRLVRMNERRLP